MILNAENVVTSGLNRKIYILSVVMLGCYDKLYSIYTATKWAKAAQPVLALYWQKSNTKQLF